MIATGERPIETVCSSHGSENMPLQSDSLFAQQAPLWKERGFYAAIIVENRNPLLENIIADFEMTAQVLTGGKP